MKPPAIEFSRPLPVNRVSNLGSRDRITAEASECESLALRFDIPKIHSLEAFFTSMPWRGGGLKITGDVDAEVEQVSIVSLENFTTKLKIDVERYFLPPHKEAASDDDVDTIENGVVDLGEIAAEALALELDPYPRIPGEVFEDRKEDVDSDKVMPFGALAKLAVKPRDTKK